MMSNGEQTDTDLKRIVARATTAGDIATNVSQINDVLEDQALAIGQLLVEEVGSALWAESPGADDPNSMAQFAADNPAGSASPILGDASPIRMPDDLLCMLKRQSPWSPSTPRYFVMHSDMYYAVLQSAWASGTGLIDFRRSAAAEEVMAHFADVPLVACDHISTDEDGAGTTSIYLVRAGQGPHEPQKIGGVRLLTSEVWPSVEIGSSRSQDGAADEYFMEVSWNIAFTNFSRSSVVRTSGFSL